ncbi:MAG: prolyl oligopeptidase family serine peptidase [Clostridium sp.]|uniref:prolyl oligopeptidase family serine peptidase n=1 Tax=Clostridium sp. TaxID=1506 RepID=UPI00304C7B4E
MRKDKIIENYHGRDIYDPYRWLEDINSDETKEFIMEHNESFERFIGSYKGYKEIKDEITNHSNYDKGNCPVKDGEHYYFLYKSANENQPRLYRAKDIYGQRQELVNPNELSEDGTCAITGFWPNDEKNIIAYAISSKGSDWQTIHFVNTNTCEELEEKLTWCKFTSFSWLPDGNSAIYTRYPKGYDVNDHRITYHNMISIHKIGTDQLEDENIIDGAEKSEYSYNLKITKDKKHLLMYRNKPFGIGSLKIMKLEEDVLNRVIESNESIDSYFTTLIDDREEDFDFLGNRGEKFYFLTEYKASNKRVVEIDINNFNEENWVDIVKEDRKTPIENVVFNGDFIAIVMMEHGNHKVYLHDILKNQVEEIKLSSMGAIDNITFCGNQVFLSFSSFFIPSTILQFNVEEKEIKKLWYPYLDIDFDEFVTEQVFVESKDGTKIPMFINRRKDIELNGDNRVLLYAYGGFNLNRIPEFRVPEVIWIKRGGIYAVANIRGGSEYGKCWHEDGMLNKKQNCFDDFISCGEWLIDNKYTSDKKLAIRGRSNGGLLTASCMVQRPELFGAVISQVPVIDMLRYQKFTVGRYWIPEYGDGENNKEDFYNMIKYSPLHNVKYGTLYPPVLIVTGDSDDRVLPCHSYKFAATLDEAAPLPDRVFLRVEKDAGHGQGKPISKLIDVEVDIYSFLEKVLG